MAPFVTVLIRTYNSQNTIQRAIESVFNQTIGEDKYEILIVDDGSTDDTVKRVKSSSIDNLIESNHKGSIPALNIGLKHVDTDYFILLDSDDWFEPEILDSMDKVITKEPDTDFIYSDYYEVTGKRRKIVSVEENIFHTVAAGIMFSTKLLRSQGFYDEDLIFPEYDLLIKILPKAKRKYIQKPLYNYSRRKDSLTANKSLILEGKKQLYNKYGKELPIRDY